VTPYDDLVRQAKAARAEVEAALDANGWPWNLRLSRWLDGLITLEEGTEP
jgi:hypothetical protein